MNNPACLFRFPAPLLTAGPSPALETSSNGLGGFGALLGAAAALVLVLFLAYKATRLMARSALPGEFSSGGIEILACASLGPDCRLMIVRLRGCVLLLGVTPSRIDKLAELDPALYEQVPPAASDGARFSALLGRALGGSGVMTGKKKDACDE